MIIRKKTILVLGIGPTHGLEHTLTAEKCILLILLLQIKNFVKVCITMEQIVTYLLMVQKYVYDFSVDYDATSVDDIKDIHKYLMKKNDIV